MIFGEQYNLFSPNHNSFRVQVHLFHAFFLRCENRSLKSEMIKQSHLAAKIKEELFELKSNEQHKSNLRTQILVHDSFNILETTPMPSSTSFCGEIERSQEREEKKCNWCQIPFNCFDTRNKLLKHIRNCKSQSVSQSFGYNSTNGTFFLKFVSERCVLKSAR